MCGKRIDNTGESSQNIPAYPELMINDVINLNPAMAYGGGGLSSAPEAASFFPWTIPINPLPSISGMPTTRENENYLGGMAGTRPSASPSPLFQGYQRRGLQFGFDRPDFFSSIGIYGGSDHMGSRFRGPSASFGLQADISKLTAQEIMDAKALAASKNHSEAERRRRGRINGHLERLRTLLPNTTKTDKASLLAEVIQHVKELKRQTSEIAEASPVPTEIDELTVDPDESCGEGKLIIKASICCEDRSDLLADLIKTLKSLRLRTLKAEITTLGGRVRNVLVVTGEEEGLADNNSPSHGGGCNPSIGCIQEALKAVMERQASDDSSSGSVKRQRTNLTVLENRSI
ncbi:Transcription factor [Nymphaea thermarum]|nr:Transcription factor [Nymphaea thermarum]